MRKDELLKFRDACNTIFDEYSTIVKPAGAKQNAIKEFEADFFNWAWTQHCEYGDGFVMLNLLRGNCIQQEDDNTNWTKQFVDTVLPSLSKNKTFRSITCRLLNWKSTKIGKGEMWYSFLSKNPLTSESIGGDCGGIEFKSAEGSNIKANDAKAPGMPPRGTINKRNKDMWAGLVPGSKNHDRWLTEAKKDILKTKKYLSDTYAWTSKEIDALVRDLFSEPSYDSMIIKPYEKAQTIEKRKAAFRRKHFANMLGIHQLNHAAKYDKTIKAFRLLTSNGKVINISSNNIDNSILSLGVYFKASTMNKTNTDTQGVCDGSVVIYAK